MKQNMGGTDRAFRLLLVVIFIVIAAFYSWWWLIASAIILTTVLTGKCPPYSLFGISTSKKKKRK